MKLPYKIVAFDYAYIIIRIGPCVKLGDSRAAPKARLALAQETLSEAKSGQQARPAIELLDSIETEFLGLEKESVLHGRRLKLMPFRGIGVTRSPLLIGTGMLKLAVWRAI